MKKYKFRYIVLAVVVFSMIGCCIFTENTYAADGYSEANYVCSYSTQEGTFLCYLDDVVTLENTCIWYSGNRFIVLHHYDTATTGYKYLYITGPNDYNSNLFLSMWNRDLGLSYQSVDCSDRILLGRDVYSFTDWDDAVGYITGNTDLSSNADNYDDISFLNFDSNFPCLSYLNIPTISSNKINVTFGIDNYDAVENYISNNNVDAVNYHLVVTPIYSTSSGMSKLNTYGTSGAGSFGKWLNDVFGVNTNTWEDSHIDSSTGLLKIDNFPDLPSNGTYDKLNGSSFCKGNSETVDSVFDSNSISKIFSFSDHGDYVFCGAYLEVFLYADFNRSPIVYYQKFNNSNLNAAIGLSSNIVEDHDDFGDNILDDMGNSDIINPLNYTDISNSNVIEYVNNGYGLLGNQGYLQLSQRFFAGVPVYIWGLLAFALSVNIIVIVFKALRGM